MTWNWSIHSSTLIKGVYKRLNAVGFNSNFQRDAEINIKSQFSLMQGWNSVLWFKLQSGFSIFDIYDEMNGIQIVLIDIKVILIDVPRNPEESTIFLRLRENCSRPRFVYFKNIPRYYRKIWNSYPYQRKVYLV